MNFTEELQKLNIQVNDQMLSRFELYYNKLVTVNEYMNLTAITERDEVYNKHFLDSLTIQKAIGEMTNIKLCDVGSGAGFPSIPLAIVRDDVEVTIIDALNKRIKFLNELSNELSLTNVNAYHYRAEDYVKEKRGFFDVVTARAVARLNILLELCMPLVKIGGYFVAMKGNLGSEELQEAKKAIEVLGGKIENTIKFDLPEDAGEREIIVIKKIKPENSKYPRPFAKIKEKPIK